MMRLKKGITLTILMFLLGGCLGDEKLKQSMNYVPLSLSDGWVVSDPSTEKIDAGKIRKIYTRFFSEDEYKQAYSLLIIRNGKIIAEGYARDDADAFRLNNIKSVTKSVTSMLTGIAIEEKFLQSATQTVSAVIPGLIVDAEKEPITIEHLLTMQSGLHWDNWDQTEELMVDEPSDSLAFVVDQPLDFAPGTRFHYADGNFHLLSGVIQEATGLTLEEYGVQKLLGPLGIGEYFWEQHRDGVTYGAYGLYLTPRDFAKLGLLAMQGGKWNGTQLVPQSWLDASFQIRANQNEGPYGYGWWIRPDYNAVASDGHGGQFLYMIPTHNVLMVMTANPYTDGLGVSLASFEVLVQHLIDGILP